MSSLWQEEQAHDGCSWRTCVVCSPPVVVMPSGKFSMRWPTAGSMRGGHVFEPTSQWVPAIDGIVGSVLPTPVVQQGRNETSGRQPGSKHHAGTTLQDVAYKMVHALLPTPVVNDMGANKTVEWWDAWAPNQKAADGRHAPHGKSLSIEVQRLLGGGTMPTPSPDGSGPVDDAPPPQ